MDELVNTKLTYSALNGAEGFNNKFIDIVNSLKQQGHVLDPRILKGIYLGNVKDKLYENIKDNAAASENTSLADIQSQILRKYLSSQGERRSGAPKCTQKRFVNRTTSHHRQVHWGMGRVGLMSKWRTIGRTHMNQEGMCWPPRVRRPPTLPIRPCLLFQRKNMMLSQRM